MSYINRLNSNTFTESDIAHFYIDNRFEFGPFIREIGDFIAHPQRDQGKSLEATIGMYSQFRFTENRFTKKNTDDWLRPIGECEWWLKPYFLKKLSTAKPTGIKKNLKMSGTELKKEITGWFPPKNPYPTRIEALNPFSFNDIVNFLSRDLDARAPFKAKLVKSELKNALKKLKISTEIVDDFLVGTAVLLSGKKVVLPGGVSATVSIRVSQQRHTRVDGGDINDIPAGGTPINIHPDGPLDICVTTSTPAGQGWAELVYSLLDTEIDTEFYFDRKFIDNSNPQSPQLNIKGELQFHSSQTPKVSAC